MNKEPLRAITEQEVASFQKDGIVNLSGILDNAWVEYLRDAVARELENPGPKYYAYDGDGPGKFHGNQEIWQVDDGFAEYCLRSPLPAIAGQFLAANKVNLYFDHLFVKEPGAQSPTPWHNDQPYWPINGTQVMSFWLALDEVTKDSGAVEFICGSHKWDRWFQPKSFADSEKKKNYDLNENYEPLPDFDKERGQHKIVSFDMKPGDLVAFHSLTVHGSGGNQRSDRSRRGYAVRYTGDDVTYDPRKGTSDMLLDDALKPDQVLDSNRFPVVWRKSEKAAGKEQAA